MSGAQRQPLHCRFDGDGMLHACRFKDGKVSYCNRYIQTNRLNQEQRAQRPIFGRVGHDPLTALGSTMGAQWE